MPETTPSQERGAMRRIHEEQLGEQIPGELEWFEGKLRRVVDPSRCGWWRFHKHYDSQGYCDNPARGY